MDLRRPDLHPSFKFDFSTLKGGVIQQPQEWEACFLRIHEPDQQWPAIDVELNGVKQMLEMRRVGNAYHVAAKLPPLSPGRYELVLIWEQLKHSSTFLVSSRKIDQKSYEYLLGDLNVTLPGSIALTIKRGGGLGGVELLPPDENTPGQELVRLRRIVEGISERPGLVTSILEISKSPHRVLKREEHWTKSSNARRPTVRQITKSLLRQNNVGEGNLPRQVLDGRASHNLNNVENRLIVTVCEQTLRRLIRLKRHLERVKLYDEAIQIDRLFARLTSARRSAKFLDNISVQQPALEPFSMVLLRLPAYRAILEASIELNRRVSVNLEEPGLDAPIDNLPRLYQVWCFLQLIKKILIESQRLGYKVDLQRLYHRRDGELALKFLPGGLPALVLSNASGRQLMVYPERTFGKSGALRSISYNQRPDISVEIASKDGGRDVYIFDAKYKLGSESTQGYDLDNKPKKDDIDKMHAYRDAIVDECGNRVVRYAAILYPGPTVRYDMGLEALSAVPNGPESIEDLVQPVLDRIFASG